MKNLTTSIEQRDEIAAKLGGYAVVRDLAVRAMNVEIVAAQNAETYGDVAARLRGATAVAEALETADRIIVGEHPLSFRGDTKIGEPEERLSSHDREVYAARMLVWTLDTSGEAVRRYLAEALPCTHDGETGTRTAHGKLGDAPAGTVETLCLDCGTVLASEAPEDPFDAFARADLEANGVDPAKAAEVVANTYGDRR